jgi:hypothetical protein
VWPGRAERWFRRNAERNELQALPDLASCARLLYLCVYPLPLLSVTCRYRADALRWFAAGSSATTASQLFPVFRPRCSGCAQSPPTLSLSLATPLCACRVHGGGVPSGGLWRTCSEASNNTIARFYQWSQLFDYGLRVLCAPHPRSGGGGG